MSFELGIWSGDLYFHIRDNQGNNIEEALESVFISDGDWHKIFLIYDGIVNKIEIIVNDQLVYSQNTNLNNINSYYPITIGKQRVHSLF